MRKVKIKKNKLFLIILLLVITIGYALLSTNINIIGSSKFKDARWDVHLDNLRIVDGSVSEDSNASIDSKRTSVNYNVNLNTPGEYYEFLVDVVNEGTIDGMVDMVSSKMKINDGEYIDIVSAELPNYLRYSVTYQNGMEIKPKYELKVGERQTYRVRVEYRRDIDISDLPVSEQDIEFLFSIDYVQKDTTSIAAPKLKVGDYISLVPDSSTYTVSKDLTGYDSDQTINPSELTLWRIIQEKEDGTFDAVSEYVSSKDIIFKGTKGYANMVYTLQDIAKEYNKEGYTLSARSFGYDGQTMTISDTSYFDGTSDQCPATQSTNVITSGEGSEFSGGSLGDNLYVKDYNLVKNTYGDQIAISYRVNNQNEAATYWRTSRLYLVTGNGCNYSGSSISKYGILSSDAVVRSFDNSWTDSEKGHAIRPIITLNSNLLLDGGNGTSSNPYYFS